MKPLLLPLLAAACCCAAANSQSLLVEPTLEGSTEHAVWTDLSTGNTNLVATTPRRIYEVYPDNFSDISVEFLVHAPGYGASGGLYSWTGAYHTTVRKNTASFAIKQAVFQLDLVWDPSTSFPAGGGPKLNYNGGNQNLAPLSMTFGGSREVENNTGIPEMEGIDSFVYRGVAWQWDLSEVEGDINTITITMPLGNHTSVVGSRIDVASEFEDIGGVTLSPIEVWRENFFQTHLNEGDAADTADPDGDGIPNLIEYALGTAPNSASPDTESIDGAGNPFTLQGHGPQNLPVSITSHDRLRLAFMVPVSPPAEITYRVTVSDDLENWTVLAEKTGDGAWIWKGGGSPQIATKPTEGDSPWVVQGDGPPPIDTRPLKERIHCVIGDEVPASSHSRRFMRLEASY